MLQRLLRSNALIRDHVILASWKHAPAYINVKELFSGRHPRSAQGTCMDLILPVAGLGIDVVVGPESGGIALAQGCARLLTRLTARKVHAVTAWKRKRKDPHAPKSFYLKSSGKELIRDKRVLVVEDVITTADSVAAVAVLVTKHGGTVMRVRVVVDRSGMDTQGLWNKLPFPTSSILRVAIPTWENASVCQLCIRKVPVNPSLGRGRIFLETHERQAAA